MNKNGFLILITLVMVVAAGVIAGETADTYLAQLLCDKYTLEAPEYEVEVLSSRLPDFNLDETSVTIKSLSQKDPIGLFTTLITITDPAGKETSGQVRFRIHRFAEVLVATDRIKRSTDFTGNEFEVRRLEVTTLNERALVSIDETIGYRSKRNLRKGQIITTGSIELIPDIISGRPLSILYSNGLCQISAEGVALQNGVAGEYVKVRNKTSGKIIIARVISKDAVAVNN